MYLRTPFSLIVISLPYLLNSQVFRIIVRGNFQAHHANIPQKKTSLASTMMIAYHEQGHNKRLAADKFEISPKQLCRWLKNKEQLMMVAPYTKKIVYAQPKYLRTFGMV
ncbi:unnamed protein product [Rhizophagus irregularis]|uniref:HTH psq-type domain-containing protein n=1 Tax=Rhizophagus irregularis TaxID=588596 RepID=A0A2N1MQK3_9GLOM|nr:hypothetical protein RhiirC2_788281 [Rhizophagus irregularis]CAB4375899.1 unnamed protein product [Rhizophagus irregularis]CAB5388039.1 unnamed protein product [Rhizophagus irregularis]